MMNHSFAAVIHVAARGLRHNRCALGSSGGCSPFVWGMHAGRSAVAGFCFASALAVVQAWLVASESAKAARLCGNIRSAML